MTSRCSLVVLGVAILVIYGMVLPQLFVSRVAAHVLTPAAVRNGRLDYYFGSKMDLAKYPETPRFVEIAAREWNASSSISVVQTTDPSKADIVLETFCSKRTEDLGRTDNTLRIMKFNGCLLAWKGGKWGRFGKLGRTPASRRARTFVHEFGHALGLHHTPSLNHKESVMSVWLNADSNPKKPLRNYYVTYYLLRSHDKTDIKNRWP